MAYVTTKLERTSWTMMTKNGEDVNVDDDGATCDGAMRYDDDNDCDG